MDPTTVNGRSSESKVSADTTSSTSKIAALLCALTLPGFLFMSGIATRALSIPDRIFWAIGVVYFVVACLVTLFVMSSRADFGSANASPSRKLALTIIVATVLAVFGFLYFMWNFDLDDKWVYYRVSENVLRTGLPLWNFNEMALVGASFFYPYILAPGHLFGGPAQWDLFQKFIGVAFHLAAAFVVLRYFQYRAIGIVYAVTLLLFAPSLQWSLGGLETAFTTLWIIVVIVLYLRSDGESRLFWIMAGLLIYIRPDAILLGVGAFGAQFLRQPTRIGHHIVVGTLFSIPILVFLASNQLLFGFPLPLVFLVKGWNCAYCGNYPIYYKAYIGMIHMLSGISVSALMSMLLVIGIALLAKGTRLRFAIRSPIISQFPLGFDLMVGLAIYLGYHVLGGYQHMNFTFRYWIPGLLGATFVACSVIDATTETSWADRNAPAIQKVIARMFAMPVVVALLLLQFTQTTLATYYGKVIDITLTISPLKDQFSIDSYASYIASWMQAGLDLAPVVRPQDRLFLLQGMATGAFTKGYLVDQFYFPPNRSKFEDLRNCVSQAHNQNNCNILYDYYLTFAKNLNWPPTHEVWKEYQTIAVLKRKSFPVPAVPTDVKGVRISADSVDLHWMPSVGEFKSEIEVQQGEAKKIANVPPDYRVFRLAQLGHGDATIRIRSCNDKGCSDWSAPVVVK